MDLSIATSFCFSSTIIHNAPTMLNATINKVRLTMAKLIHFSIFIRRMKASSCW